MRDEARTVTLVERHERVETPEHVAIGYELADLGSRFTALAVDLTIVVLGLGALWIGGPFAAEWIGGLPSALAGIALGIMLIVTFALIWGYFVVWEGFFDGRTPGKRLLRIRVLHDGGFPLTVRGAAIRNLLRLIDIQPFPSWLLGGAFMMLHSRTKRVGDIAAGTIVVRERRASAVDGTVEVEAAGPPRLSPEELAAVARYIARRKELREDVRDRLALRLVERVGPAVGEWPTGPSGESSGGEGAGGAGSGGEGADAFLVRVHAEETVRHAAAGGASGPRARALARRQRATWAEYRGLLELAHRRGLARLSEGRVTRFARLYREIAADLARARSYRASPAQIEALEAWVGAGHNLIYRPTQRSWALARGWLAHGFPALVRCRWQPIALAALLFYAPAVITFAAVRVEPLRVHQLVPAEMVARAESAPAREAAGEGYIDVPEVFMPVFASGIIANNVQVTFAAFAGGVLAGLGTLGILVFNGVHLGAVAAAFANHGASLNLWTFVLPHGVLELTAICIAGGAGLWLAAALLIPGRRTRREALVTNAKEAVSLLGGAAVLLVIAGLIEGFVSPAEIARGVKLGFAAVVAVMMVGYLGVAGRITASPSASLPGTD